MIRWSTELRAVDEGAVPASAPATSRLFVLPAAARRWVSTDNKPVPQLAVACKINCGRRQFVVICHVDSKYGEITKENFGPTARAGRFCITIRN